MIERKSMIRNKRDIMNFLKEGYGGVNKKEYTYEEFENISNYYRMKAKEKEGEGFVDEGTWNDVDMDDVYLQINNTNSSIGQEYLYYILRKTDVSEEELKERDRVAEYFDGNEKERLLVGSEIYKMGYAYRISLSDYLGNLKKAPQFSNFLHYLAMILFVCSILFCVFVDAAIGVGLVILCAAISVISYYKCKSQVEAYFSCVKYIIKMVGCAKNICKLNIDGIKEYNQRLKKDIDVLDPLLKGADIISDSRKVDGSLAEVLLDYVRMLTHIDLIKFNNIKKKIGSKTDVMYSMYETLGFLEAMIAVASYRKQLPYYSKPKFRNGFVSLDIEDAFHPLINNPVANSITTRKSVLITGSNASGKSTFLKTVGINAILSQTIYTSISHSYSAPQFEIYSSIALNDNLSGGESYYMVEIKSLKRILNKADTSKRPVLCFVDEVLRGTNTIERIAASSQILKSFATKHVLCFAATHDIELTKILSNYYDNYHFREEVGDKDITFSYIIHKGAATTRNAIKLLGMIGYDKSIIKASEESAAGFVANNEWEVLE